MKSCIPWLAKFSNVDFCCGLKKLELSNGDFHKESKIPFFGEPKTCSLVLLGMESWAGDEWTDETR